MKHTILAVDDDEGVLELIKQTFGDKKYTVVTADSAAGLVNIIAASKSPPDIILLDINLPDGNGFDILQNIKQNRVFNRVPVIMLTGAQKDKNAIVRGLTSGAQDYIMKPFDTDVLRARVEVAVRVSHFQGATVDMFCRGGIKLCPAEHKLSYKRREIQLTPKEFDIFFTLLEKTPAVVTKNLLLARIWGDCAEKTSTHTIEEHICSIKKKLGEELAARIITIHGSGYKFS